MFEKQGLTYERFDCIRRKKKKKVTVLRDRSDIPFPCTRDAASRSIISFHSWHVGWQSFFAINRWRARSERKKRKRSVRENACEHLLPCSNLSCLLSWLLSAIRTYFYIFSCPPPPLDFPPISIILHSFSLSTHQFRDIRNRSTIVRRSSRNIFIPSKRKLSQNAEIKWEKKISSLSRTIIYRIII